MGFASYRESFSKVLSTELAQLLQLLRALFHPFEAVLSQYKVPLKVSFIPHSPPVSQLQSFLFFHLCFLVHCSMYFSSSVPYLIKMFRVKTLSDDGWSQFFHICGISGLMLFTSLSVMHLLVWDFEPFLVLCGGCSTLISCRYSVLCLSLTCCFLLKKYL